MEELKRDVEACKGDISDLKMRVALAEKDIKSTIAKLDKIDANTTWILRLILGSILTALLGLVIMNGGSI